MIRFGCFPIIGRERSRALGSTLIWSLLIREPRAVEGNARIRILLQLSDKHVAIGKPGMIMMRDFLQYPAYFLSCLRKPSIAHG